MRRLKSVFILVLIISMMIPNTVYGAYDTDVINWLACIVSTHLRVAEGRRIQDEIKKNGYTTVPPELLRQAMNEVTIDFDAIESSVADTFYSLNPVKQFNYHQLFEQYMDTDFQINNDILKDMAFDKFVENARSDGALRIQGGGGSSIGGGASRVFGGGGNEPTPTPKPTTTPTPTPTPEPPPTPEPTEVTDPSSRYFFDSSEVTRSQIVDMYRSKDFGSSAHNSSFQGSQSFFQYLNGSLFNSYFRADYVYEVVITTSGASRTVGSYIIDNSLAYSAPVSGYYKYFILSQEEVSFGFGDAKLAGYPSSVSEIFPEGSLYFGFDGPTVNRKPAWIRFQHYESGQQFTAYSSGNYVGYITGSIWVREYHVVAAPVVPITPEPTPAPTPPPANNYIINLPDYAPTINNNSYYNNYYIHEADQYTTVLIEGNTTNNDYGDYSTTYQDYITNNITNNNYQTSNVTIINNYTEINNYNTDDTAEPTPTLPPGEEPGEPEEPGEATEGYFSGFFADIYAALTSRFGFIAQISDAMEAVALGREVTTGSAFGPGPVLESGGEALVSEFSGEGSAYDVYKDYNNYDVPVFEFTLPERYGGGTYQLIDFSYFAEYRLYIFNFVRFIAWFIFFKRTFRYLPNIIYR